MLTLINARMGVAFWYMAEQLWFGQIRLILFRNFVQIVTCRIHEKSQFQSVVKDVILIINTWLLNIINTLFFSWIFCSKMSQKSNHRLVD